MIDSGADCNIAKKSFTKNIEPSKTLLCGLQNVPSAGKCESVVQVGEISKSLSCEVVEDEVMQFDFLLGIKSFKTFGIQLSIGGQTLGATSHTEIDTDFPHLTEWISKSIKDYSAFNPSEAAITTPARIRLKDPRTNALLKRNLKQKPYRMETAKKAELKEILEDLMKKGVVEKSNVQDFSVISPAFLVEKGKTGKFRLVLDFRLFNQVTEDEYNSLSNFEDILQSIKGAYCLSTFDLIDGYYQVKTDLETQKLQGLCNSFGIFKLKRLGQGMKQSAGIFHTAVPD